MLREMVVWALLRHVLHHLQDTKPCNWWDLADETVQTGVGVCTATLFEYRFECLTLPLTDTYICV